MHASVRLCHHEHHAAATSCEQPCVGNTYKAVIWVLFVLQHLPASQLTYNMHILVCRLYKQEEARGCTATCGELWVERDIQYVKCNVKYRTTSCPEKLFVHDHLVDKALAAMRHDDTVNACVHTAVF